MCLLVDTLCGKLLSTFSVSSIGAWLHVGWITFVASIIAMVAHVPYNCFTETETRDELCNVTHAKSFMCLQKVASFSDYKFVTNRDRFRRLCSDCSVRCEYLQRQSFELNLGE